MEGSKSKGRFGKDSDVEEFHVLYHGRLTVFEVMARGYVLRPRLALGLMWLGILGLSAIVGASGVAISELTFFDWSVSSSLDSQNDDALTAARELAARELAALPRTEEVGVSSTQFIFSVPPGAEILTAANLQRICDFQTALTAQPEYPKFCSPAGAAVGLATECAPTAFDLVAQFYPTPAEAAACAELGPASFAERRANLTAASNYIFFKPRGFASGVMSSTRSYVPLFGPLGSDSTSDGVTYAQPLTNDNAGAQGREYASFLLDVVEKELFARVGSEQDIPFSSAYKREPFDLGGGLSARVHNRVWRDAEFDRLINWDQLLAGASVVFVGVAMLLHLRSVFLATMGLLSIVFSIPVGLFVYQIVLGVNYFTSVSVIVIFLVLGIGADDVFVFVDAYYQSERFWFGVRGVTSSKMALERNIYGTGDEAKEVLIARVAYAYARSAEAVFNTSFTTTAAFLATSVSPVVPVAAFGVLAAICVLVNFLFTLILYPAFVVVYELHFRGRPFCCACLRAPRPALGPGGPGAVGVEAADSASEASMDAVSVSASGIEDPEADAELAEVVYVQRGEHVEAWEEKLFSRLYVPAMLRETTLTGTVRGRRFSRTLRLLPVVSSAVLLVLLAVMASFAVQLSTPTKQDEPFSSSHLFFGFLDDFSRDFQGGTDFMVVSVAFGIGSAGGGAPINRDGFKRYDPNGFRGTVILEDDFDLAPQAAQEHMLGVCADLLLLSCIPAGQSQELAGCVAEGTQLVKSVECTLQDFHDWHNETYPLETPAVELGDENATLWAERLFEFSIAEARELDVGFIDGTLRFMVMRYEAALKSFQPVTVKEPVVELLDAFLESTLDDAPPTLQTVLQTCFDMTWSNSELGIVEGMFTGLAISLPVAYIILLYATSNVILASIAIVAILGVIASVLGTAFLLGWSLGVAESIASVMVVGLSVDFSIHHGSYFSFANKEGVVTRAGRFRYSALNMGGTVVAAAITTSGSASVMFATELSFFRQMATLISATIGFSLLFTEGLFMPLALLIGPENDTGNWKLWLAARVKQIQELRNGDAPHSLSS